ncbi:hypothetical protein TTHERM_00494210 (macronuclear) [Tetrahymena thermophila SB210]|uniref:Prefoldin subunit n=1 Tax=Tetrahymena thermophila (strain SB210) TaxID=312017 RepID=I7MHH1_TETTS|nr:hypothetical protein TTHERM_00494210 [Tetrahymena thermophila SB210]EAS02969.2 hypothetical protein TTHERM_00494210 [Tetrahymena thermophila SB210]|eukprot:XP_001023214.2 hypothetical protein TTHERM_00494210 [Tetrahymena thermophila SB210]
MTKLEQEKYLIDQNVVKQQEEISIQIYNLQSKSAALGQQRESNKQTQSLFTTNKLKDEKKIFYLASNNFIKMKKEEAFKILEKDQSKILHEKKKIDQQIKDLLQKLSKMKPYIELLDFEIQEMLIEYVKDNEDMDED